MTIYAYTQTIPQYFKMTKLNEIKVEDIILMYKYFKRINQQYRGKLCNNEIDSLAKAFKLSASTIRPVVEGTYEGPKSKRKSRKNNR